MKRAKKKRGLTVRQKAFVREYLIDLNGTQAAIRAGYSKKTAEAQASALLRNLKVNAKIREALDKRIKKAEISVDRTLNEIACIAFSDIKDYITIGSDGCVQVLPFEAMPEGASRAIQSIKEKKRILSAGKGDGEETILESTLELKLWDKGRALEQLGKYLDLLFNKADRLPEPVPITIELINPNGNKAD